MPWLKSTWGCYKTSLKNAAFGISTTAVAGAIRPAETCGARAAAEVPAGACQDFTSCVRFRQGSGADELGAWETRDEITSTPELPENGHSFLVWTLSFHQNHHIKRSPVHKHLLPLPYCTSCSQELSFSVAPKILSNLSPQLECILALATYSDLLSHICKKKEWRSNGEQSAFL